jgi:DNA-binding transcriptional MerR regulator
MTSRPLKVGELAERTGLSVRTLHHYEEIGLLVPSHRTVSNHRLYTADDVARLQRIKSLRQLGFGLDRISEILADPATSPLGIVEDHVARVREEVALQTRLLERLEAIAATLRRGENVDVEQFLKTIEVMTMWENKFTPEQIEEIRERGRQLGPERVRAVEGEWVSLLASLRAAMEKGTDPKTPEVQALVRCCHELTREFSGGNQSIEGTLTEAYRSGAGAQFGVDVALMDYMAAASRP